MIDLSIDISYLSRYMGVSALQQIGAVQKNEDDGKYLTIETMDGNVTVDVDTLKKLIKDPEKLAKILMLQDPMNRYMIIKELNEDDLNKLLPFLSSVELSFGLQYFTTDGLGELLIDLPPEQLIGLLMEHFTMEDVTPFMKENEMDNFFKSTHLERKDVMDYFKALDYQKFQSLMINQFGIDFKEKTSKEYLDYIDQMDDGDYHRFLLNMRNKEKMEAIAGLCKLNEDYYYEFDNTVLVRPMLINMEKSDIIKTMTKLEPEFLIPMIEQLPQDLIQVVATQINAIDFSQMLASEFPDLIMEMLAA